MEASPAINRSLDLPFTLGQERRRAIENMPAIEQSMESQQAAEEIGVCRRDGRGV